jgi:hypothetical protein
MSALTFPFGSCYPKPDDKLTRKIANLITQDTPYRAALLSNLFVSKDIQNDRVALILDTLPKAIKADAILCEFGVCMFCLLYLCLALRFIYR